MLACKLFILLKTLMKKIEAFPLVSLLVIGNDATETDLEVKYVTDNQLGVARLYKFQKARNVK